MLDLTMDPRKTLWLQILPLAIIIVTAQCVTGRNFKPQAGIGLSAVLMAELWMLRHRLKHVLKVFGGSAKGSAVYG